MTDERLIQDYLLGDLSEEEKARVEERMFADDDFYEQIQAIKSELIDDCTRGELPARDRETFAGRFLTTSQGRERGAFSRAMTGALSELRANHPASAASPIEVRDESKSWRRSFMALFRAPALQFSLAAATVLLALGGIWLFAEMKRLQSQLEQSRTGQAELRRQQQEWRQQVAEQRTRNEELSAQLARELAERERMRKTQDQSQLRTPAIFSFILSPGLIRGAGEPEKLVVPKSANRIRLQLDLDGDDGYRSFRAELRTVRGDLIWSRDGLRAGSTSIGKSVFITLPASALENDEYELTLRGAVNRGKLEDIGYYYFNVIKH
jgi:hypothetical protein